MNSRILQVCVLLVALFGFSFGAHAQYVGYTLAAQQHGSGVGSFSLVQKGNCSIPNSSSTCTATMSQALVAGNLDFFDCTFGNSSPGAAGASYIIGVTAGGTFQLTTGASIGGYTTGGANQWKTSGYILPSTSTGGSATEVITFNQTSSAASGGCALYEYHPSANGSNVGLDIDFNYELAAASTSPVMQSSTLSGTNDVIFQDYEGIFSFGPATAISSPYNTNLFNSSEASFSSAITSSGTGPTWTSGSRIPLMGTIAFGWNPTACLEQSLTNFSTGTNGNAPAAADLLSGMKGWAGIGGSILPGSLIALPSTSGC